VATLRLHSVKAYAASPRKPPSPAVFELSGSRRAVELSPACHGGRCASHHHALVHHPIGSPFPGHPAKPIGSTPRRHTGLLQRARGARPSLAGNEIARHKAIRAATEAFQWRVSMSVIVVSHDSSSPSDGTCTHEVSFRTQQRHGQIGINDPPAWRSLLRERLAPQADRTHRGFRVNPSLSRERVTMVIVGQVPHTRM
jgi:hypothetical protein